MADLDHTNVHAADVLHAVSYFITHKIGDHFSALDILSSLYAAIVHDFEHPGVNNNFLIATQDERAILYNDRSVLESHHVAASFRILLDPAINFFPSSFMKSEDWRTFRSAVIDMVLATDLQQHFTVVNSFKGKVRPSFNLMTR